MAGRLQPCFGENLRKRPRIVRGRFLLPGERAERRRHRHPRRRTSPRPAFRSAPEQRESAVQYAAACYVVSTPPFLRSANSGRNAPRRARKPATFGRMLQTGVQKWRGRGKTVRGRKTVDRRRKVRRTGAPGACRAHKSASATFVRRRPCTAGARRSGKTGVYFIHGK